MYFSQIKHWSRPWWQPKWVRRVVNHFWPYESRAKSMLVQLDQLRILFGLVMSGLLISQFSVIFNLLFPNTKLLSIGIGLYIVSWMFFGWLAWHQHQVEHSQWSYFNLLFELCLLPLIFSSNLMIGLLLIGKLYSIILISPLIGTIIGSFLIFNLLEYGYLVLQWQFYYQHYVSQHPGYKTSLF